MQSWSVQIAFEHDHVVLYNGLIAHSLFVIVTCAKEVM